MSYICMPSPMCDFILKSIPEDFGRYEFTSLVKYFRIKFDSQSFTNLFYKSLQKESLLHINYFMPSNLRAQKK